MAKKVLVVDDEEILREMVRDFLELEDFEVFEASNGQTAFEIVKAHNPDCVISDVRMSGGDGIELAQSIHKIEGKKPKVILMTGFSDISESMAQTFGVARMVQKPFSPKELMKIVKRVIEQK